MEFIYYFHAFVLGVVQGFTEFLPISSTAHLLVSIELLSIDLDDFMKSFVIIIQLASILAVLVIYWSKIFKNFALYFKKLLVAFIPTAIIGVLLYPLVRSFFQESFLIMALALFFGGIVIIVLEKLYKKDDNVETIELDALKEMSYKQCFYIGLFQSIAMIPGVSRSAATIFGGLSLGLSRKTIVEFSFLLAIPTMLAATVYDVYKNGLSFNNEQFGFLFIGFAFSFLVALIAIKFLLNYIKNNNFIVFAWYRILLALFIVSYIYL